MSMYRVEGDRALALVAASNADQAREAAIAQSPRFRSTPCRTYNLSNDHDQKLDRTERWAHVWLVATPDILAETGI